MVSKVIPVKVGYHKREAMGTVQQVLEGQIDFVDQSSVPSILNENLSAERWIF